MTREALAEIFGLKLSAKWALFTYHAETTRELQYNLDTVNNCVDVLKKMEDYQIMATYSNADFVVIAAPTNYDSIQPERDRTNL